MRFSAQGYARLNEILAPDIAVLEGIFHREGPPLRKRGDHPGHGGSGHSAVRELDHHAEALRQSDQITRHIERTAAEVMQLWKKRREMKPWSAAPAM